MTTNIENRIKFARLGDQIGQLGRVGPQILLLLQELLRDFILLEGLDGVRVEGGFAAMRRCDGQVGLGMEDLVGVCEFRLEKVKEKSLC